MVVVFHVAEVCDGMGRLGVALGVVSREHRLEGVEMREGGAG